MQALSESLLEDIFSLDARVLEMLENFGSAAPVYYNIFNLNGYNSIESVKTMDINDMQEIGIKSKHIELMENLISKL